MSRLPRRFLALVLLLLQVSACTTWTRPNTSLAPAAYVSEKKPGLVLVITHAGDRIQLRKPLVVGDSLIGEGTTTRWGQSRIALPRDQVTDMRIVQASAGSLEAVDAEIVDGRELRIYRPVISADSVTGFVQVPPEGRPGVPVADIKQLRVTTVSTAGAVAGFVALTAVTALMICAATCTFGLE